MQHHRGPSLEGAYLRVARAREHIQSLDALVAWYLPRAEADEIAEGVGQITPPYSHYSFITNERLKISLLLGEAVGNLRSALDYLAHELAFLDSRELQSGTKFPICRDPNEFAGQWGEWLKGVDRRHVAAIYRLQPADGCKWTYWLREISNQDKHRELARLDVLITDGESTKREAPLLFGPPQFIEYVLNKVDMKVNSSLVVNLDNWYPVVGLLILLETQVTETLRDFDACFDSCEHGPDVGDWPHTPEPGSRRRRTHAGRNRRKDDVPWSGVGVISGAG